MSKVRRACLRGDCHDRLSVLADGRRLEVHNHAGREPVAAQARPGRHRDRGQDSPGFRRTSPSGRTPAIVNSDGPGGDPIGVIESGAILQDLGNKTGQSCSVADMSIWPWTGGYKGLGADPAECSSFYRWFKAAGARQAVQKGSAIGKDAFVESQRRLIKQEVSR